MEQELEFEDLDDDVSLELRSLCEGAMPAGEVRVRPTNTVITRAFKNSACQILDLEIREDDIWVVSFPKCGTTWTQEMVWLLKNNLNYNKAKSLFIYERFPFLEYKPLWGDGIPDHVPDLVDYINNMKSPRFMKTHLPAELLPRQIWTKKPKIIYVFRNPKDAAISYYHHFKIWNNFLGSQELFFKAYIEDKVIFSPFWKHVLSYWRLRKEPNVLFNTFEEMKEDLPAVIKRTAEFLDVEYNENEENALLEHLSFANMKNNKAVNFEDDISKVEQEKGHRGFTFMRQGQSGGWKKVLSPEFSRKFDEWTEKNLKGTDFPVPQ